MASNGESGRFSAKRKSEAVVRLLRGEDLELLSRAYGVTAAWLGPWRDSFLAGGQAALKKRVSDERDEQTMRTVTGNSRTLGFTSHEFERE